MELAFSQIRDGQEFMEAIWPSFPDKMELLIWTLPDEMSYWFPDPRRAVDFAVKAKERDVYIGVGLATEDYVKSLGSRKDKRRCTMDSIAAIPGFYLDIDIEGQGRKKKNLFESREEAEEFINDLPLKPTVKIWSGGGFQLWFLFKEAWIFESSEERNNAQELSMGWNRLAQSIAAQRGKAVDSTFDFARVFRMAGTFNYKHGTPNPVVLEFTDGQRCNPSDFEQWRGIIVKDKKIKVAGLVLSGDAEPPFDRYQALMAIDPDFRRTVDRKRKDFVDQSASSYDLSIANQLVQYDWTDQEIVNTLIAVRRRHGSDLKLREKYYADTISKARSQGRQSRLTETVERLTSAPEGDRPEPLDAENRSEVFALINGYTGVEIERIVQHGHDSPQYSIMIRGGKQVKIGSVSSLTEFRTWVNIAMVYGVKIPHHCKAQAWNKVLTAMKLIMEVDESIETSREEVAFSWVRGYASEAVDLSTAKGAEVFDFIEKEKPFTSNGVLYIRIDGFKQYLRLVRKETIEDNDILYHFRLCGLKSEKMQARKERKTISRHYWSVQMNVLYPYQEEEN